ncbi:MAG: FecR domain-containing protein [Pseudomonadota bacterium]
MRKCVCVLVGLLAVSPAFAQTETAGEDVGVVAAVNRIVTGERPAETSRVLSIKDNLVQDERITTSPNGGGQVMFLDQTTLTLTPNSNIVLDRYVYDPATQSGSLAVTMLSGAMRMVGGRITKEDEAIIRTPSATIGIRGGIGHVTVREDGSTRYMHIAGFSATITTEQGTVTMTREGGVVEISAPGDGSTVDAGPRDGSPDGGPDGGQRPPPIFGADGEPLERPDGGQLRAEEGTTGAPGLPIINGGVEPQPRRAAATPADEEEQENDGLRPPQQGGIITYLGVATPEIIAAALGTPAGFGDGGSPIGGLPGLINDRIPPVQAEISGAAGAVQRPPISTTGEQQSVEFAEQPEALTEVPVDDIADINQAEILEEEITQAFDGILFNGTWSAVAGLADGTFSEPASNLGFVMAYSLRDEQGILTVELPPEVALNGVPDIADQFIVVGDGPEDIAGDATVPTGLGGDASDTALAIGVNDVVTGSVFVDYEGSALETTSFVEGLVDPTLGTRLDPDPINDATNDLRNLLDDPR